MTTYAVAASAPGVIYEVTEASGAWRCTCPSYIFSRQPKGCKHIERIKTMTTEQVPCAPRATLYRKIAAVTAAIRRIPKNGKNTFHNYKYATESDLTDGIRDLLEEHGLAFLPPTVLSHERIPLESKSGPLTRVQMQFTLACCDTGEIITSVLWADGQDQADKGFYKAYTGGVKYFLMKTFLVSTGDDPEQDHRQQEERRPAQQEERRPARPAASVGKEAPALFEENPAPKSPVDGPLSAVARAKGINEIRRLMTEARSFGYILTSEEAGMDLEGLSDDMLKKTGQGWRNMVTGLRQAESAAIPA